MITDESAGARIAWVALGSNLGARGRALAEVRAALSGDGTVRITAASRVLVTRAVGIVAQPDFHNQVLRVEAIAPLEPEAWLARCQAAEWAAGRRPTYRWGPRRADADLLLLGARGDLRATAPGLIVPHPQLAERPFLCALLAGLDPGLRHPDGWRFAERAGPWGEMVLPGAAGRPVRPA